MLKRTKGRFLLTLLVITGLAGTIKNSTLTKQERKLAINELKESKTAFLQSVKDLSDKQLNFRPSPESWNIRECIYHIALAEKDLWSKLDQTMKAPSSRHRPEMTITDEEVLERAEDRSHKQITSEVLQPQKAPWSSVSAAISAFKIARTEHIKYAKSTTEDMREHFLPLAFGQVDAYQYMLFISGHSERHLEQIREIQGHPAFPSK